MERCGGTRRDGLIASGEMADRVRAFDWSTTPLGPIETWPDRWVAAVEMMLVAPQLTTLTIGPERVFVYNDHAAIHYGRRHPGVLGQRVSDAFPHEFAKVERFYERVFAGESLHVPVQALDPAADGNPEVFDAYLTPLRDVDGSVFAAHMTGFAIGARLRAEANAAEVRTGLERRIDNATAELKTSHELLRVTIDSSDDLIQVFEAVRDPSGEIVDFRWLLNNHRSGRPYGELAGESLLRRNPGVVAEGIFDAFKRVTETGVSEQAEHHYAHEEFNSWFLQSIVKLGDGVSTTNKDITAWKTAQAEITRLQQEAAGIRLRQSEAQLAAVIRALPVGVHVADLTGRTILTNAQLDRFLPTGVMPSRDPYRGWRWRAWDAAGRALSRREFPGSRALRGEVVLPGVDMLYTDDSGRELWTTVSSAPILDDDGQVVGQTSIITDVDAMKRNAEALRISEERLRQFGEASQDVLWIRDAATLQWLYLTPAFEPIYGRSREEALSGDSYRNWKEMIVPEDRDGALANMQRVCAGEHVTYEYRIRRPDGAIRWLRNTDFPIRDETGRIVMIGGIDRDFTEARETELRFRTLVEGMPQLVWRAMDGGRWTWASPQWTATTGQDEGEYRDWGWLDALHPDDRAAARAIWSHALDHGGFRIEFRIRQRDCGTYRWFQTSGTPVLDGSGAVTEWLGTSTDIDELRRLQDRQSLLLGELQHRVRNILTVVRSVFGRTVDAGGDIDAVSEHFKGRLDSLARAQVIVTQSPTGLADLEMLIRNELLSVGASDGANLSIEGPDVALPPKAAESIGLAIHELTTNALKYGALKTPGARLDIRWLIDINDNNERRLDLGWTECGVPAISLDPRPGFGSELINEALPYQLGAETSLVIRGGGVRCTLSVPLSGEGAFAATARGIS